MGTWNIHIRGLGCHHNNNRAVDADLATADFVRELQRQGHQISEATFALTNGDTPDAEEFEKESVLFPVPATNGEEHILQFFESSHLPSHLAAVSYHFGNIAKHIVETLPRNPERTVALRKLLEAKDAAVRALLAKS